MVSEPDKMLLGEPYDASDPALVEARIRARRLTAAVQHARSGGRSRRASGFCDDLLGELGAGSWVEAPFHCDYGAQIRLGARVFVNMCCVFLDAAPITLGDDVQLGPGGPTPDVGPPARRRDPRRRTRVGAPHIDRRPGVARRRRDRAAGRRDRERRRHRRGQRRDTRRWQPGVMAAGNPCRVISEPEREL